jgi:outer membrane protein OmpA-like peptidoglycan-associated protein
VLDTNGFVVTHMAQPYVKPGAPNYFPKVVELLGAKKKKRIVDVSPYTVREFGEQDSVPASVALAVDYSGSMKGVKEVIDLGTEMFIGMMRPCDSVSFTGFHKEITTVFSLSIDTTMMLREFRAFKQNAQGLFTSSYDGIMTALKTLQGVPMDQPKVCVVFADGDENMSMTKLPDIFEYATRNNISIYCVGFAYAQDENLENLSLYTGGKYYRAYTKKDLLAIFMDIWRSLRNYYLVTYVPPTYEGLHTVNVSVVIPGRDTMLAEGVYDKSPLTPVDPKNEFTRHILFAYNKAEIDSASAYIIDELADALFRYERVIIEIQGHTDNIGNEEFNQTLSEARANSVRNALMAKGIEPERMRTKGFGFTIPVAPNDTEEGRAQNRRTVFKVLRR